MYAEAICRAIYSAKFSYSKESDLQRGIAQVLTESGVSFKAEVRLSDRDRIDFLTDDGTGIEVKVDMSPLEVVRQLWRYADRDEVKRLVLVTTRAKHKAILSEIKGKPVFVVHLLNSAL